MEKSFNVENKAVLVTGASRGLGAALARALAARGARVVAVARNPQALEEVVQQITGAGGTAYALSHDVADQDAVHRLIGAAAALVGPLDVVIHNASCLGPVPLRGLMETHCEELEAVLATNLVGPFRITKAVAANMAVRGGGLLVHISSDAAVEAYPGWGAYSVSKAALDHLSRILAAELAGTGVRSFSVDPGEMDTRMHADAVPDADPSTLAQPDAVAAAVLTLMESPALAPTGSRVCAAKVMS